MFNPSREDPLEKEMTTHSSIPEEPDGLQSKGSQRVRHNCVTKHNSLQKNSSVSQGVVKEQVAFGKFMQQELAGK